MESALAKRYYLYAKSFGLSPTEALARDSEIFPDDKMEGFVAWNKTQIYHWAQAKNTHPDWAVLYREEVSAWIEEQLE